MSVLTTAVIASTSLTSTLSTDCSDISSLHLWRIHRSGDDEAIDDAAPGRRRRQLTTERPKEHEAECDRVAQRDDGVGIEYRVDGAVSFGFVDQFRQPPVLVVDAVEQHRREFGFTPC